MTQTGDMLVTASSEAGASPTRTCIGCRATRAQARLLRFARGEDGRIVPANITRGVHGRTTYLCPQRSCLDLAIKRRAFARAFGSGRERLSVIDVDPDRLWAATAEQLRCEIGLLGRSSENPHAHPRRRGLEQLLSELSSQPKPPERGPSKRGLAKQQDIVTSANESDHASENADHSHASRGGAPNHG
jgi:predicted RNA-binding protein YlxR (DUF448 family)